MTERTREQTAGIKRSASTRGTCSEGGTKEMYRAVINQMMDDGRIREGALGTSVPEEWDYTKEVYDDLSGKKLDPNLVAAARAEEMEQYRKHRVYRTVPIALCWERTGKRPIGVRWVDVNKGDEVHPDVRCRLVAKETRTGKRLELFAATPPMETKTALFSAAVTEGTWYKHGHMK